MAAGLGAVLVACGGIAIDARKGDLLGAIGAQNF
jgi:hypothetical protein